MKFIRYSILTAAVLLSLNACNPFRTDLQTDPNYASVESVQTNATKGQLDNLAIGQFSLARNVLASYTQVVGTIGKELFNFNSTESRWMTELNGLRPIDNSSFYNTATTGLGLPVRKDNVII